MSTIFRILLLLSFLMSFTGCSSKPAQNHDNAQKQSSKEQQKDKDQKKMDDFLKNADDF